MRRKFIKHIGTEKTKVRNFEYVLANDGYIYQFENGQNLGWICNYTKWESFRKVINKRGWTCSV